MWPSEVAHLGAVEKRLVKAQEKAAAKASRLSSLAEEYYEEGSDVQNGEVSEQGEPHSSSGEPDGDGFDDGSEREDVMPQKGKKRLAAGM